MTKFCNDRIENLNWSRMYLNMGTHFFWLTNFSIFQYFFSVSFNKFNKYKNSLTFPCSLLEILWIPSRCGKHVNEFKSNIHILNFVFQQIPKSVQYSSNRSSTPSSPWTSHCLTTAWSSERTSPLRVLLYPKSNTRTVQRNTPWECSRVRRLDLCYKDSLDILLFRYVQLNYCCLQGQLFVILGRWKWKIKLSWHSEFCNEVVYNVKSTRTLLKLIVNQQTRYPNLLPQYIGGSRGLPARIPYGHKFLCS